MPFVFDNFEDPIVGYPAKKTILRMNGFTYDQFTGTLNAESKAKKVQYQSAESKLLGLFNASAGSVLKKYFPIEDSNDE